MKELSFSEVNAVSGGEKTWGDSMATGAYCTAGAILGVALASTYFGTYGCSIFNYLLPKDAVKVAGGLIGWGLGHSVYNMAYSSEA
jgi:hypothetical protein